MLGSTMFKTTALVLASVGTALAKSPITHLGSQGAILCKSKLSIPKPRPLH